MFVNNNSHVTLALVKKFLSLKAKMENEMGDYARVPLTEEHKTVLRICPACKGSGFLDFEGHREDRLPVALPKIKCPSGKRSRRTKQDEMRASDLNLPLLPSKPYHNTPSPSFRSSSIKLPPVGRISSASSDCGTETDLIGSIVIENDSEFNKMARAKLKSWNLNEVADGVVDVVHISKIDETTAYTLMPQVNRQLCSMLRSLKVKIVRQACQAIAQLFGRVSYVSRPEFDEIVVLLVNRTADTKKSIRLDAEIALDVIVNSTPAQVVIRAIYSKGPRSKNVQIKMTTAKLISTVLKRLGPSMILNHPSLRETRKKFLQECCHMLEDQNGEVRSIGRDVMLELIENENFDEALHTDVPNSLIKSVEKSVICLKFGKNKELK